jgi:surface protein
MADSFNQDISSWDVSNVSDMSYMYSSASSFNQDISNWNVSSVQNMSNMFFNASSFNQDISSWCVQNISIRPQGFDNNTDSAWSDDNKPAWGDSCEVPEEPEPANDEEENNSPPPSTAGSGFLVPSTQQEDTAEEPAEVEPDQDNTENQQTIEDDPVVAEPVDTTPEPEETDDAQGDALAGQFLANIPGVGTSLAVILLTLAVVGVGIYYNKRRK